MTRQEALQLVDIELELLEELEHPHHVGVPLFHIKDTGEEIVCLFNDPRYETITIEYDWERMGMVDNDFGS